MNTRMPWPTIGAPRTGAAVLVAMTGFFLLAAPSPGQEVELDPYFTAQECTALIGVGDKLIAGTSSGGVLFIERSDPSIMVQWVAGRDLGGKQVSSLAWTGRFVWVATYDNGMTRVGNLDGDPTFRQYLDNLGSRKLSCVTGTVIGDNEVVYYGMVGEGIGKITDGVAGFLFTAEEDGLISDDVTDLQFVGEDLFIGTSAGVSRLRNALFSDQVAGLTDLVVNDLCLDSEGALLAGGPSGVFRWNATGETWEFLGDVGVPVVSLAAQPDGTIWALGANVDDEGNFLNVVLRSLSGSTWTNAGVPYSNCRALFADDEVWVAGGRPDPGMAAGAGRAVVTRVFAAGEFENWNSNFSQVGSAWGVGFGAGNEAWIGFWESDAISIHDPDGTWRHINQVASAANDWTGLMAFWARAVCFGRDLEDHMWAGQFGGGLLRVDPQTLATELVKPDNSGLQGTLVLNILSHPDGPLLFLHDRDGGMVDVLLDPADWENEANWISLPQTLDAIGSDAKVWDAVIERRDVIWFAVEDVGLVRWDINGSLAGPDDELTWTDGSDDQWAGPIIAFTDSTGREVSDPTKVKGLALDPAGGIWAGGTGLVRFLYDPSDETAEAREYWTERTLPFESGLISGSVSDVVVDVNGDTWALTSAGLNRLRHRGDETTVDLWIDPGNYFLFPTYRALYSPNVIAAMPGGRYNQLAIDATGTRILASSEEGAVELTVDEGFGTTEVAGAPVDRLYCYPNPWLPAADGGLKLGGFPSDAEDYGPAYVEIYNVEGQLVYRHRSVAADTEFWWGQNRPGEDVTTGLYVVKVTWQDETRTRTLAVVR